MNYLPAARSFFSPVRAKELFGAASTGFCLVLRSKTRQTPACAALERKKKRFLCFGGPKTQGFQWRKGGGGGVIFLAAELIFWGLPHQNGEFPLCLLVFWVLAGFASVWKGFLESGEVF